jgi:3'-phosphoadenosine 5'-phosphosulfate sulfotransferase (PAPS reductase)/FAD synthetase
MKIVVSFSGGKDSLACLIWAEKNYGANNVTAVFCDTGWEHPITYQHVQEVCDRLSVELVKVKSKKYKNFMDLARKKRRFPSTKARFCTEELKQKPMIDWVLAQQYDMLIVQGIRAQESASRAKLSGECSFFKYYFQPYKIDKKGKKKYHTYRKKDVLAHTKKFASDIIRPVFDWSGLDVMNFIIENGLKPNPLYYRGFSRVGCFPCIMCRHAEIKLIIEQEPQVIDGIRKEEQQTGRYFFPPGYIPDRFCSGMDKNGKRFPYIDDVVKYLSRNDAQMNIFEEPFTEGHRCMSIYGLCE